MKKVSILLAMVLVLSSCASAPKLTPDQKRTLEAKPGVVLVSVEYTVTWNLVKPLEIPHRETGTGFIYRPDGYIITNGHVVEDAHLKDSEAMDDFRKMVLSEFEEALKAGIIFQIVEQQIGRKLTDKEREIVATSKPNISVSDPSLTVWMSNSKSYTAKILQWDNPIGKGKDVSILKIAGTDLPTVRLGDSEKVSVQDPVVVIGYPGLASRWGQNTLISSESNFEPTATNGHISAIKKSNIDTPLLQSDAAITHGNSGGPVFNAAGEVIGIATAGAQSTQGFNYFVPINTAMEFVRQAGAPQAVGSFDPMWNNALDLYDQGKCKAAIAEFDNVLHMMPGLPDAKNYRNLAAKCWDEKNGLQKFMETSEWVVYAAGGIVVLAILALMLRRKPDAVVRVPAGGAATVRIEAPPIPAALPPRATQPESYGSIQGTGGALSGKTFKVTKEGLLIGRSSKCQVILQDDTISGEHAWIVPTDNEVVVIDRGSANGTYVNSIDSPKVSKIGLRNGDRIYLGKKGTAVFTYFNS